MYEKRDSVAYSTYGGVNRDQFTWKIYPSELKKNSLNLYELEFNMTDVKLLGSDINPVESINRFQVRLNNSLIHSDSYYNCT